MSPGGPWQHTGGAGDAKARRRGTPAETPETSPQDSPPRRPWSLDPFTGPLESPTPGKPVGPAHPS